MKAVFDTNILVDYLNGEKAAAEELALYEERHISVITHIEVLVGATGDDEDLVIRKFLAGFKIQELSTSIAEGSIRLRRQHKLKVPDAIIYATAREEGCLLVTRNTKDFDERWPDIREPYRL